MIKAAHTPDSTSKVDTPQYARPASIEEWSNRALIHPVSGVIAALAIRLKISANAVSFAGLLSGWVAAWFYMYQDRPWYVFGGLGFMVLWHVLDGADGRVARATGTSSAFGRIIDGICDHLVFGAVYIAILLYLTATGAPAWVWGLGVAAGLSHAIQAAGYEERRQKFQRRSSGISRLQINDKLLEIDGQRSALASLYDRAQKLVSGPDSRLDVVLDALRPHDSGGNAVQALVNKTAVIVRAWSLLNANNRTVMIFVFCALGKPLWYFIYEVTLLNLVLFMAMAYERYQEGRIAQEANSLLKARLAGHQNTPNEDLIR